MKNIHILPTTQPSKLHISAGRINLYPNGLTQGLCKNQHIYITSDEEIGEGDWRYNSISNTVYQKKLDKISFAYEYKIILTTDPTLIKDGVQSIDDEFLEWFVKNSSCEFVEVELEPLFPMYRTFIEDIDIPPFYGNLKRKIIIPQEEPKQEKEEEYFKYLEKDKKEFAKEWEEIRQEFGFGKKDTLEEAAEKRIPTGTHIWELTETRRCDFIAGAKWQSERMYSEEDVLSLILKFNDDKPGRFDASGWFEQFKKK